MTLSDKEKGTDMNYFITYCADCYTEAFETKDAWNSAIEEIAETTCFDIDIQDNVAIIDDGDPSYYDEDYSK